MRIKDTSWYRAINGGAPIPSLQKESFQRGAPIPSLQPDSLQKGAPIPNLQPVQQPQPSQDPSPGVAGQTAPPTAGTQPSGTQQE